MCGFRLPMYMDNQGLCGAANRTLEPVTPLLDVHAA